MELVGLLPLPRLLLILLLACLVGRGGPPKKQTRRRAGGGRDECCAEKARRRRFDRSRDVRRLACSRGVGKARHATKVFNPRFQSSTSIITGTDRCMTGAGGSSRSRSTSKEGRHFPAFERTRDDASISRDRLASADQSIIAIAHGGAGEGGNIMRRRPRSPVPCVLFGRLVLHDGHRSPSTRGDDDVEGRPAEHQSSCEPPPIGEGSIWRGWGAQRGFCWNACGGPPCVLWSARQSWACGGRCDSCCDAVDRWRKAFPK